jgi:putative membrane protein
MNRFNQLLILGAAGTALAVPGWSQEPAGHPAHTSTSTSEESVPKTSNPDDTSTNVGRPSGTDPDPAAAKAAADFVLKAGIDGMTEVQLARLALSKSGNAQVRELAGRIVSDQTSANDKLGAVAQMKNISMPKQIDAAHESVIRQLSAKQGPAFDSTYLSQTIAAHARAITLFTAASGQLDSEIAAFAYRTLPTLKTHKQMAESLKLATNADADGAKGS